MDQAGRTGLEIRLPLAGGVLNTSVSAVAIVVNLASAGGPATQSAGNSANLPPTSASVGIAVPGTVQAPTILQPSGFVGRWIDIYADGADLGIVAGPTNASVSGANAPALATTGTAVGAGQCMRIPNGFWRTYFVTADTAFLGIVASAAGTARICASSRI